jgi:hypothetical protein
MKVGYSRVAVLLILNSKYFYKLQNTQYTSVEFSHLAIKRREKEKGRTWGIAFLTCLGNIWSS